MRKLLTFALLIVGTLLFAQPVVDRTIVTNYTSTSTMGWNTLRQEWDFYENNDRQIWKSYWQLTLFDNQSGRIQNGDITYTVSKWSLDKLNGVDPIVRVDAYNHTIKREVSVIINKSEETGEFMISIFDAGGRMSYYFWQ